VGAADSVLAALACRAKAWREAVGALCAGGLCLRSLSTGRGYGYLGNAGLIRLAPVQPMRYLQLVYFFMTLVGGCLLGKYLLKASIWRWAAFLVVFNGGMLLAQRLEFSSSDHLELPDGLRTTHGCRPLRGFAKTRPPMRILPSIRSIWPRRRRIITAFAPWRAQPVSR